MKTASIFMIIITCLSAQVSAQKSAEVSLRYSRQDSVVRIVLEAEDDIIRGANTITSVASVKVEFPGLFELKKPKDFPLETVKRDRVLAIALKDAADVRAYKLASPSRVVIEVKIKTQDPAQNQDQKQQPAQKAGQPKLPDRPVRFSAVVLDPGHGGYDYGIFIQELKEKDASLNLAKDLSNILIKRGTKVSLTRRVDQSIPLGERINFSNGRGADLFLSLHATSQDKFVITSATAEETVSDAAIRPYKLSSKQTRHLEKSRTTARTLAEAIKAEFNAEVLLRELPLPILSSIDSPALLLEYPLSVLKTHDPKDRDRLAGAIIKGLAANE